MKKILKTQRELIAAILFFVVIGLLIKIVIVPLIDRISGIKTEIEESNIKQALKKQRLDELPKIRQQYSAITDKNGNLDLLLDKDQAVSAIERMEKLAQDTNNEITISISDSDQSKPAAPKGKDAQISLAESLPSSDYLKFKITLLGNYEGLYKFISSLESLEFYSDIISINIGQPSATGSDSAKTRNGDVLNPFSSVASSPVVNTQPQPNTDALSTSLEVAFYTKK